MGLPQRSPLFLVARPGGLRCGSLWGLFPLCFQGFLFRVFLRTLVKTAESGLMSL